jgi:uncharacterized protein (DUF885 family)
MNDALSRLAEGYWEYRLEVEPTRALMLGDHRYDDRHESASAASDEAHVARLRAFARDAESIDPADLTADELITREVLIETAQSEADHVSAGLAEIAVNPVVGVQAMMPVVVPQYPIIEPEHADRLVDKYRGIARMFGELADRVSDGAAAGRTPVGLHAERTVGFLDDYLASDVAEDPYLRVRVPVAFDADAEAAWKERLAEVVRDEIRPAYARFRDVIANEALPVARSVERPGLVSLPGGDAAYGAAIRRFVTLDLDPEAIHRTGLEQVERLADEYRTLGGSALGTSDLAQIFDRLRNDPDLHFDDGPSIIAAAEAALHKAKEAMGSWFGHLPAADCGVSETPTGPLAFYFAPAEDGSRPGTFFVNTSRPSDWGTFQMEAMAYHEGIPGHHLQLAIAQERSEVPAFRRNAFVAAYSEGWGLYSERLADEMGLYSSDLDRIGMLWGDSMRSCRLVVDTGMHALGWSRRQAIDFMVENSPMAVGQIEGEVDRYIGMPGQALSYMIGRLEIDRLRSEAEARMGDRFDLPAFHDVVIGSGMVPLATLGRMVGDWSA